MIYQRLTCSFKAVPPFLIGSRFFVILTVIAIGFSVISSAAELSNMQLIVMRVDGHGFMERDSGRGYIVFGTNYYDPHTGW